jgi:hypothetical protein
MEELDGCNPDYDIWRRDLVLDPISRKVNATTR